MPNEACNFAEVFEGECAEIAEQCCARGVDADLRLDDVPGSPIEDRLGIAFSGGGIRSASVGLGIAQRLARAGILRQADYFSGISGGGYLVGWLTAWTKRKGRFADVEGCLGLQHRQWQSSTKCYTSGLSALSRARSTALPAQICFVPDAASGPARGDTLAAVAIYLRNVLLNQIMLAAALISLTLLLQLLTPTLAWSHRASVLWLWAGLLTALVLFIFGVHQIWKSLVALAPDPKVVQSKTAPTKAIACGAVICILIWLILPDWYAHHPTQQLTWLFVLVVVVAGFSLQHF